MSQHVKKRTSAHLIALKTIFPMGLAVIGLASCLPAWSQDSLSVRSATSAAETTGPLTLQQALALAMSSNAELTVAQRELEAAEGPVLQGGTRPNPALSVELEDQRKATRTTTFQISQAIELGGKRRARIDAAERNRDIAAAELSARRAEVRSTVVLAFRDVLLAQERIKLAAETTELARRGSQAASRRVQAGKVSPVEETKAKIAEATAGLDTLQAQSELMQARQRLAATWGSANPRFERAEPSTGTFTELPFLPTVESLMSRLASSPSLQRVKSNVALRQAIVRVENSKATADVTVSMGVQRDAQSGRNLAVVGLSMPFGVFDRNQGNILEALKREEKARDELALTELQLRTSVLQAHARLEASRIEAQTIRDSVLPGAQAAYDAATKGFELGKFDFLDVLDAQRTLFQARAQYQRASGEAQRLAIDIDRQLGDSTDSDATPTSTVPTSPAQR